MPAVNITYSSLCISHARDFRYGIKYLKWSGRACCTLSTYESYAPIVPLRLMMIVVKDLSLPVKLMQPLELPHVEKLVLQGISGDVLRAPRYNTACLLWFDNDEQIAEAFPSGTF